MAQKIDAFSNLPHGADFRLQQILLRETCLSCFECLSFLPVPSLSWQSIEVFCACPEPVLANRRRF
eukprot:COSAG06_NODE_42815_length_378_cov_0.741935_1_plen_65_part_10